MQRMNMCLVSTGSFNPPNMAVSPRMGQRMGEPNLRCFSEMFLRCERRFKSSCMRDTGATGDLRLRCTALKLATSTEPK